MTHSCFPIPPCRLQARYDGNIRRTPARTLFAKLGLEGCQSRSTWTRAKLTRIVSQKSIRYVICRTVGGCLARKVCHSPYHFFVGVGKTGCMLDDMDCCSICICAWAWAGTGDMPFCAGGTAIAEH